MNLIVELHNNPLLSAVPIAQLEWLTRQAELIQYQPGDFLFRPGSPIEVTIFVLDGQFELYVMQSNQRRELDVLEKGDISGLLPFSRAKVAIGHAIAVEQSAVLCLHKDHLRDMVHQHYELTEVLVQVMTSRVRDFTRQQVQNEKMISLGKLSAGLAHELNNPASAIVRSADALQKHLSGTPEKFKKVMTIEAGNRQTDAVSDLIFEKMQMLHSNEQLVLPLLERSRREEELIGWLEDFQVCNAYEIAAELVDYGFVVADLERLKSIILQKDLDPVINWIVDNLVTNRMVSEIGLASQRIAKLIHSIKSYTHMDRATAKSLVSIDSGLENTLVLLNHKLKSKNIQIVREYDPSTPQVDVMVGELNQVWTNLIDNAVDAMDITGGILKLEIGYDNRYVIVKVKDNGHGIPFEIQDQVFDPFFTTKEIGKGSGMGLEIARNIIQQHEGCIELQSEPGNTIFTVFLPIH